MRYQWTLIYCTLKRQRSTNWRRHGAGGRVKGSGTRKPWSVQQSLFSFSGALDRLVGLWFVFQDSGPSHGAMIHPAGPWFVFRGPGPSRRVPYLTREVPLPPPGPWSIPMGPDPSLGALIRPAEPCSVPRGLIHAYAISSVPRGSDSSYGTRFFLRSPASSHRAPTHPAGPWCISRCPSSSCGVLVGPTGRRTWSV